MLDMVMHSIQLFFQGKLFQNPTEVLRQIAVGTLVTAVVMIAAALAGAPLWLAGALAGLAGGLLQPFLFRNLKYR